MTPLDALNRCRDAWERSQPQTFLELYPDGLDEGGDLRVPIPSLVEPADIAANSPAAAPNGGLAPGAEPRHGTFSEPTAMPERDPAFGSAVALARDGAGSAPPLTTTAPAADPRAEQRGRGDWRSV